MDLSIKSTASSSRRRKQKNPKRKKDEAEEYLEELVLGDADDVLENLNDSVSEDWANQSQTKRSKSKEPDADCKRKPAWIDTDDSLKRKKAKDDDSAMKTNKPSGSSTKTYSEELQSRFTKIIGTPSWADLSKKPRSKESLDEDTLVTRVGDYLLKSDSLPEATIDVKFCRSLAADYHELGCITSVEFHPTAQVALAAGLRRKAILFQVDGVKNRRIQSIPFKRFPIDAAHFSTNGKEFIVGSKHQKHFYTFDMLSGKKIKVPWNRGMDEICMQKFYLSPDGKYLIAPGVAGAMHFLSAKTKEWIYTLKMNSNLRGLSFNGDNSQMYSFSKNGEVYIWDMKTRDCIHKFYDDGCVTGTTMALSPNQQYLACGADCGFVNIYNTASLFATDRPKPEKVFKNLLTPVSCMKFNCTSEILAMCSSEKENAVKLIHFPSKKVFNNFPNFTWNLGSILNLDISLNSGYLATCTKEGVSHLFRLNHYGSF